MTRCLALLFLATLAPSPALAQTASAGRLYVNERAAFTGELAEMHVPFSFTLPRGWRLNSDPASRGNFVEAYRPVIGMAEGEASEIAVFFPVSLPRTSPTYREWNAVLDRVAAELVEKWNFHAVEDDWLEYDEGEFLPTRVFHGEDEDEKYWARLMVMPTDRTANGAGIGLGFLVLGSTLAPEFSGPEDVGISGEVSTLLESFESEAPSNVVDTPGSVPSAVSPPDAPEAQPRAAGLRTGRYVCQYLSFGLGMPGRAVIVHDLELSADGTYRIRGSGESGRYTVVSREIRWVSGPFATGEYRAEIQQEGDVARFLLILGDGQGDGKRLDCRWNVE